MDLYYNFWLENKTATAILVCYMRFGRCSGLLIWLLFFHFPSFLFFSPVLLFRIFFFPFVFYGYGYCNTGVEAREGEIVGAFVSRVWGGDIM